MIPSRKNSPVKTEWEVACSRSKRWEERLQKPGGREVGCEGRPLPALQGPESMSHIKECGPCPKRKGKSLKGLKQKMGQIRAAHLKAPLVFLAAMGAYWRSKGE